MSKKQTEFMEKHKSTSELISKVISGKTHLDNIKDDLLRRIDKVKPSKVACACPNEK